MGSKTKQQKLQKRQDNPDAWGKKKLVIIIYTGLMVIYGFYTMIIAILAYEEFSGTIEAYDRIINNLSESPIEKIEIVKEGAKCQSGWEALFEYNWQGTQNGCNCLDALSTHKYKDVSKQLYTGACNTNQTKAGCHNVSEVKGKTFQHFQINGVAQNVCLKRLSGQKYYKDAPQKASCSSSEKSCGISGHAIYCVKQSEECPVYDLKIGKASEASKYPDYEKIDLLGSPATYALYVIRTGSEQPLSELRVTEGNGVCEQNTDRNIEKGHSEYTLAREKRDRCSKTDNRFVKINPEEVGNGQMTYFGVNDVLDKLNKLPNYSSYIKKAESYKYNSYGRNFLYWKVSEREKLSNIVKKKDDIDNMGTYQSIIMVVNIIVCIAVSIILTISEVYNLAGKDVPCIDGEGEEEQERIKKIKKGFKYGAKLIQTPFCILAYVIASKNKRYVRKIADIKASDGQTNKEFDQLATAIEDEVYEKNLQMLLALAAVTFVDIIMYIQKKLKKKNKQQAKQVNQQDQDDDQDKKDKYVDNDENQDEEKNE